MMKNILTTLGLCVFAWNLQAQYVTLKTYQKWVAEYEAKKDYPAAYMYYTKMIEFDQEPELYHYKAARMAIEMKAYQTADKHLAHLDTLEAKERFEDINFYRGIAAHHTGKYDQAIVYYNLFISEADADTTLVNEAKQRIEHADWANFQKPDTLVTMAHLGEKINSPYSDFGATIVDEKTLMFSSDRDLLKRDDYRTPRKISHIYAAKENDETHKLAGDINGDKQHSSNTTLHPNGEIMYYTICEFKEESTDIRCDIYQRSFDADSLRYGPPQKMSINKEGFTSTQPHCALLPDGGIAMFFASDRPGGKGKTDIYYSTLDTTNNVWGEPLALDSLNTEEEEWSPTFHTGDSDLYFSSKGYLGFGSLDIYKADWDGAWTSSPTNVGAPINTSYDDVYFILSEAGDQAFLASNREGAYYIDSELEACCFDLYRADFQAPQVELLVRVFDRFDSTDILESQVTLIDKETGKVFGPISSLNWDDYTFKVDQFKDYQLIAQKAGYLPDTLNFDTKNERGVEITEKVLFMDKLVPLAVTVWDENTGEPINGALVKLFETVDGEPKLLTETSNPASHEYKFDLIRGKSYELFGTKNPLYDSATVVITSDETSIGEPIEKRIDLVQLAIRRLEKVFPLILYFDNDMPDPGSRRSTTDRVYSDTYNEYISRKEEFITNYTKNLGGGSYAAKADAEIKSFFSDDVDVGFGKLNEFMTQLLGVLQGGLLVEVSIKGYTSPIAKGDYNLKLGRRRVECLKNEFMNWKGGILMNYVSIGKLVLKEISFGETKAPVGLSDSAFDKRNSVYSPLASKQRRVEVIAVRRMARTAPTNNN